MDYKHLTDKRQIKIVNSSVREETLDGQRHLVVPVVILTAGVHHNNIGKVLYTVEELSKFPQSWNGVPLTLFHPEQNGQPVNANQPSMHDQHLGKLYNVQFDGVKLTGELYINIARTAEIAPEVLSTINTGRLEVSTGHFGDIVEQAGEFNGEVYDHVATNHKPEHLALLPGGQGACSWQDGCGAPRNEKGIGQVVKGVVNSIKKAFAKNELSFEDIKSQLQDFVDTLDVVPPNGAPATFNWVVNVFDDYFVYKQEAPEGTRLFKQEYNVDDSMKKVNINQEVIEVSKVVSFVPVTNTHQGLGTNSVSEELHNKEEQMEKEAVVNAIVDKDCSPFQNTDGDKSYLNSLTDERLTELSKQFGVNGDCGNATQNTDVDKGAGAAAKGEPAADTVADVTAQNAAGDDEVKPMTEADFMKLVPDSMKAAMSVNVKYIENRKVTLIDTITNAPGCTYTKEQLQNKEVDELDNIASLINQKPAVPASFYGAQGAEHLTANLGGSTEEAMDSPTLNDTPPDNGDGKK